MNLRPREKDKEIGPPNFRFQPKSDIERVYDSIVGRCTGAIPHDQVADHKTVKEIRCIYSQPAI